MPPIPIPLAILSRTDARTSPASQFSQNEQRPPQQDVHRVLTAFDAWYSIFLYFKYYYECNEVTAINRFLLFYIKLNSVFIIIYPKLPHILTGYGPTISLPRARSCLRVLGCVSFRFDFLTWCFFSFVLVAVFFSFGVSVMDR